MIEKMNEPIIKMFNDILASSKNLVDTPKNINWDIAHYIADNTTAKIMMLKLHEEKGYRINQVEDFNFPTLVDNFVSQFPSIAINFEEVKAQHSQARNPFQHKLITNYLGIRQNQVKHYISLLEDLMSQLGILIIDNEKQKLFDELKHMINRLYRTRAEYSSQFVKKIYNSDDLQDLFGITIRKNDDDMPMKFLNGEYKLVPNSATLSRIISGKLIPLLNKDSPQETIEDVLARLFNRFAKFVVEEFGVNLTL